MFKIEIKDIKTAEIRTIELDLNWTKATERQWKTGDYACDCNRNILFHGQDKDFKNCPCGHKRFLILWVELKNKKRIYIDSNRLKF